MKEALAAIDYSDVNKITQALAHLDMIHEERDSGRKRSQGQSQNGSSNNFDKDIQCKIRGVEVNSKFVNNKSNQYQNTNNLNQRCLCAGVYSASRNRNAAGACAPLHHSVETLSFEPNSSNDGRLLEMPNLSVPPPSLMQRGNFNNLN